MKKLICIGLLGLAAMTGCQSESETCIPGPHTQLTPDPSVKSAAAITSDAAILKGDVMGSDAYDEIGRLLKSGKTIRMDIYRLQAAKSPEQYLADKGMTGVSAKDDGDMLIAETAGRTCTWNRSSLYEFCAADTFGSNAGVDPSALKKDGYYIDIAGRVLREQLKPDTTAHYDFYPYKKKNGIIETASIDAPKDITRMIDDVGIAFAAAIDGWPVIGPGGKAVIHMDPAGTVQATKIYRKIPGRQLARLTEKDIKTPGEAVKEAAARQNIDLNDFNIVRSEFGYFYWGRNSIQNVIAPGYAIFFAPKKGDADTVVYEIVSAVKGEHAAIVDDDRRLEKARKQSKITEDLTPKEGV